MGIDYSGGMLVGCHGDDLIDITSDWLPEDWEQHNEGECREDLGDYEILECLEMSTYCEYFDADIDRSHVGFEVGDVPIDSGAFSAWIEDVKSKAEEFERITGVKAKLIGCQHIY